MIHGFKSFCHTKIHITKIGKCHCSLSKVSLPNCNYSEVDQREISTIKLSYSKIGTIEIITIKLSHSKIGISKVIRIGKALLPFPPSKRSMRLSPHCAFQYSD